jgi:Na+/H+ antiporter NhaA
MSKIISMSFGQYLMAGDKKKNIAFFRFICFSSNVIIGVLLGLLLGKPIGILLSTWVLTKLKLGNISKTMTWRQLTGIGFLASIGFTMSMFVTALALSDPVKCSLHYLERDRHSRRNV